MISAATNSSAATGIQDSHGALRILERIRPTIRATGAGADWRVEFQAMGTVCRIQAHGAAAGARAYLEAAVQWVAAFEAKYSRFWPSSWVCALNRQAGGDFVPCDAETDRLLMMCHEMVFLTRGAFDPTALPLIRLWDWKATHPVLPTEEAVSSARARTGWSKLQRAPGKARLTVPEMSLDLGGMGKEYAVDQVTVLSLSFGLEGVMVDFGADIRVAGVPADGRPGWHIGLEDPERPGKTWCGLAVRDRAVASSGDYLRKIEINGRRYGHIVDIRTGEPVQNGCHAVSVMAPSCTLAGMLSTAAFVLGPVEGLTLIENQAGADGVILAGNNVKHASRRFYEYVTK